MTTIEVFGRESTGTSLKTMRHAYGFDEVAIVPGNFTVNPELTDTSFTLGDFVFQVPILAAATDAVVDPVFAGKFGKLGGLAVLNLEGIHTRYADPAPIFEEITHTPKAKVTALLQQVYTQPIQAELVGERVRQMKDHSIVVAVSCTPANAKRFAPIAVDARSEERRVGKECRARWAPVL